jgi:hypothetical protein
LEAVAEHQEVPDKEAAMETIRALKDWSGDQQPAVEYWNPLKRRTKDSVVQGTPDGPTFEKRRWTCPGCSNSMRDRGLKEQLHLGSKRKLNKTFRQTVELEITKQIVGCSIRP